MVVARARLASTLLALCWAASALSGCLLSQEDRVLDFPAQRNRPPRIMEELPISENRLTVIEASDDCRELTFSFSAEDPDVDEVLTVRWYVDYPRTRVFFPDEQHLFPSGKPQRDDLARLPVNLASALTPPLNQLQSAGTHIVEAVLYDFLLGPNRDPLPIPGADGGILNPSYAVTYAWVVVMNRTCPLP